jgi:hypothetical protein
MADNTNTRSGYVNYNRCRSFNQNINTSLTMLTGAEVPGFVTTTTVPALTGGMPCSEVIIINKTDGDLVIYDCDYTDLLNGLLIGTGESITLRGLTNVAQVSAIADSAGTIYYRTQFYSMNPSR